MKIQIPINKPHKIAACDYSHAAVHSSSYNQIPPSKVQMFQRLSLRIATLSFVSLPFANFTLHGTKTPA